VRLSLCLRVHYFIKNYTGICFRTCVVLIRLHFLGLFHAVLVLLSVHEGSVDFEIVVYGAYLL